MECICEASSGCNMNTKCPNKDANCGPYKIDYAYWYDSGYPNYTGEDDDFQNCAKDKECSETSVRQYLDKFEKDCNKDLTIDCLDYASIHVRGPESCNDNSMYESKYWKTFTECYGFDFRR